MAAAGVLEPSEVFVGVSMMMIGALFVLAAALHNTSAMEAILGRILGATRSEFGGLLRIGPALWSF